MSPGVKHHVSLDDISRPQQMASSCSGALLVSLFMTPLDVVKIRLQSQDMMRNKCFLYSNGITDHLCPRVNGDPPLQVLHTAEEMIRTKMQSQKMTVSQIRAGLRTTLEMEGIRGLWKGYSATLYRDVPFSAIYWPCYELFKGLTLSEEHQFGATFVSGAMAGTIAASVTLQWMSSRLGAKWSSEKRI